MGISHPLGPRGPEGYAPCHQNRFSCTWQQSRSFISFCGACSTCVLLRAAWWTRATAAVVLLLSKPVLSEYRGVLTNNAIHDRYSELTSEKVEVALRRLRYVGDTLRSVESRFDYPGDPKDAKFIELAIAGHATHIVSGDGDLLWLATGAGDPATRFRQRAPSTQVLDAATDSDSRAAMEALAGDGFHAIELKPEKVPTEGNLRATGRSKSRMNRNMRPSNSL